MQRINTVFALYSLPNTSYTMTSITTFVQFITSQRGTPQLLDSSGYIYSRKKCNDTALYTAWRCCKSNNKCPATAFLTISDNSLALGSRPHNHDADKAAPERREVIASLKRKAADQPLSATQNLLSEALAHTSAAVNETLPNLESLSRTVQRSRAAAAGATSGPEAATSLAYVLPPTCMQTMRGEDFVLYDGTTDKNCRIIAFSTWRNMHCLSVYSDWICDGTFFVAPKLFSQSYTIHSVIDNQCIPMVYILTGDMKCDTYMHILNVIRYFFDKQCPVDHGTVLIDFEKAVMNAFLATLPGMDPT